MDSRIDFGGLVVAICVAAYAAVMLDVALNGLGLSIAQIRHLSVISAVLLALPVVLDLLWARPGNID
jgi:hypothetical protein